MTWTSIASAISASFLASFVEFVEAFTIVLAAATMRGWRPALAGAGLGLLTLAVFVVCLGGLIAAVPLHALQLVVGVLLLLFGLRWLRKAILRGAGILPLHDEELAFAKQTENLRRQVTTSLQRADYLAGATAYKGVLLEGVEVAFIVLAVGGGRGLIGAASIGAALACALVIGMGALVHKPLARVPENTMKFAVGVMLSAFGVFFAGEGMGAAWPGEDLALLPLAGAFALLALGLVRAVSAAPSRVGGTVQ